MISHRVLAGAALLALAGCGGGGSSPPPPAPPANRAPVFTSTASVSAPENATGTVYTATAADPEGNPLTFAIVGGADAARFALTPGGALTFAAAPDFEAPADADRNNVYLVQLRVTDGTLSATLDLAVTVNNVPGETFAVRRVASGLSQPLYVAPVPGDTRVFVLEKGGRILLLDPATGVSSLFLNLAGSISTDGERGLLGLAPAPDYAQSGVTYVYVTNPQGDIEIRRYRLLEPGRANPASLDVILSIPHREYNNHNGGWLGFGPDGMLHILTGDGGGSFDVLGNASNLQSLLGKVLRIDVSQDAFPDDPARDYAFAPDGPVTFPAGGCPNRSGSIAGEIAACGLRNPFRGSFDGDTLYFGDVGQDAIEEVNSLRPADRGADFGWAAKEGTRTTPSGTSRTLGFRFPILEYEHGSGPLQGRSVTGGYVYRGPVLALQGQYVFGDFVTGNIWSVPLAELNQGGRPLDVLLSSRFTRRNAEFAPDAGAFNNVASFGEDAQRNLYIVDFDGEIFQIRAGQ